MFDFFGGGDKASKRPFLEISSFARYYIFDFFQRDNFYMILGQNLYILCFVYDQNGGWRGAWSDSSPVVSHY